MTPERYAPNQQALSGAYDAVKAECRKADASSD